MRLCLKAAAYLLVLCILPQVASAEEDFTMEEDSTYQTDDSVFDILNITSELFLGLDTDQENITVILVDGDMNITSIGNWFGVALIEYSYMDNGTQVNGTWTLNVTPVNDEPTVLNISLSGDPGVLDNPVTYSVSYLDVDGDDIKVSWFIDEEPAGEGDSVTRYIFPDQRNLTVIIDDGNGGTDSMSVSIHTVPPEGWGDRPDNTRNRIIFWVIFGSAGLILLAAAAWVILTPEKRRGEGISNEK